MLERIAAHKNVKPQHELTETYKAQSHHACLTRPIDKPGRGEEERREARRLTDECRKFEAFIIFRQ
jgi:hypothetical protein